MTDGKFVTWDRWDATTEAIEQRIAVLERHSEELRGAEAEHTAFNDRLARLEEAHKLDEAGDRSRRDRIWVLSLTVISGMVFPILVTAVITFLHIKSSH
jgi:hypothetical protein